MSHRTRDIIVGLTAIGGVAGVALLMFLFGYIPKILEPGYIVQIKFIQAGGLNSSSRVILDGVDIGRLTDIDLQTPPNRGVLMTAQIRDKYNVPKDVRVTIAAKLLGGSPALAFSTDRLTDQQMAIFLPKDGSAKLDGQLTDMLADVTQTIQTYMDPVIAKLTQVADDFTILSKQWTQVGANINELTAPRTLAQVKQGKASPNIHTLMARADKRMEELKITIDHLNNIIGDKQLKTDVQNMLKQTTNTAAAWEQTAIKTQARADEISKKLFSVADDMSAAIRSAKITLDKAGKGQGTIGKLLDDAQLYNNLNDAVNRLNATLDQARLLIQKVKEEGVNIHL